MFSSNNKNFIPPLQSRRLYPLQPQESKNTLAKRTFKSNSETTSKTAEYLLKKTRFQKHAICNSDSFFRGCEQRVVFDKNPFYNEVKGKPSIHKKVRYKHIMSDIGELPKLFEGSKVYDSKQEFDLLLMNRGSVGCADKKVPLTLNTLLEKDIEYGCWVD